MKRNATLVLLAIGLLTLVFAISAEEPPTIERVPLTHEEIGLFGKDLFVSVCADCHGITAKGNGPAARYLEPSPPDLTGLAARNGGEFPWARVNVAISGYHRANSQFSHMPQWEYVLRDSLGAQKAHHKVYTLTAYLDDIQMASWTNE